MAEWLKPHGLSPTQYNALRILRGAGVDGLPCTEVGARMISRDPDITRLVDRLEKRGLVTRGRGTEDRRVVRARITTAGLELLRRTRPAGECVCTRDDGTFADGEIAGVDAFVGRGGIAGVAMRQWLTPRRSGGGGVKVRSERRGTQGRSTGFGLRLTSLRRTGF